jgi:hypothetical protein
MSFDPKKSWATNLPMNGLIDSERSPDVVRIEYNKTVTELLKQKREDGSVFYVGTPISDGGRRCKFALSLETNGYFRGSGAMNFICQGGWGRGTQKPTTQQKAEARNAFIRSFISTAIIHQGMDTYSELKSVLERDTGLSVTEGEMSEDDKTLFALLGVKAYLVSFAEARGLKFVVDVPKFIGNVVQPTYATVTEGAWDDESEEVALTSALTQAHVKLLVDAGLRFKRVRRARVPRKAKAAE